ncbi:hypothetical protein HDU97_006207 [Phlyctochytrium planicorne]|nr:hypothetical protein HDU97_006207 [Phlyctochytrium planicorne]
MSSRITSLTRMMHATRISATSSTPSLCMHGSRQLFRRSTTATATTEEKPKPLAASLYPAIMTEPLGSSREKREAEKLFIIHITASRNNTVATLTTDKGDAVVWASAGTCGLKKSARGTSDAGYQTILQLAEKAEKKNVRVEEQEVEVRLKWFGPGREMAFKAIRALGWPVKRITDVTPIRHGGCRPPRKRRL